MVSVFYVVFYSVSCGGVRWCRPILCTQCVWGEGTITALATTIATASTTATTATAAIAAESPTLYTTNADDGGRPPACDYYCCCG